MPKMYACLKCAYETPRRQCLAKHIDAVHRGLRPYVCPVCGKRCSQSSQLNKHVRLVHGQTMSSQAGRYVRSDSYVREGSDSYVREGLESWRNSDSMRPPDSIDTSEPMRSNETARYSEPMSFSEPLKAHEPMMVSGHHASRHAPGVTFRRMHENRCHHCYRTFRFRAQLKKHVEMEHDEADEFVPPPQFMHLGNSSERKRSTRLRQRSGDASRLFECVLCRSNFKSKDELDGHMVNDHDDSYNSRPFACNKCPKRFLHKTSLDAHVRHKHEKSLYYICVICNKSFGLKCTVFNHLKGVHKFNIPTSRMERFVKVSDKNVKTASTNKALVVGGSITIEELEKEIYNSKNTMVSSDSVSLVNNEKCNDQVEDSSSLNTLNTSNGDFLVQNHNISSDVNTSEVVGENEVTDTEGSAIIEHDPCKEVGNPTINLLDDVPSPCNVSKLASNHIKSDNIFDVEMVEQVSLPETPVSGTVLNLDEHKFNKPAISQKIDSEIDAELKDQTSAEYSANSASDDCKTVPNGDKPLANFSVMKHIAELVRKGQGSTKFMTEMPSVLAQSSGTTKSNEPKEDTEADKHMVGQGGHVQNESNFTDEELNFQNSQEQASRSTIDNESLSTFSELQDSKNGLESKNKHLDLLQTLLDEVQSFDDNDDDNDVSESQYVDQTSLDKALTSTKDSPIECQVTINEDEAVAQSSDLKDAEVEEQNEADGSTDEVRGL